MYVRITWLNYLSRPFYASHQTNNEDKSSFSVVAFVLYIFLYNSDSHSFTTISSQQIDFLPYEAIPRGIDCLAIFNPGIEVHVLDDSRELAGVGCVAG